MAETLSTTLTSILTPVVESAGLFLESVDVTKAGRYSTVTVTVDLPEGDTNIDMDTVEGATPAISEALDAADPIKGQYTLIVTSPGAERELTTPRHYRRALGHTIRVTTEQDTIQGELVNTDDATITIATSDGMRNIAQADITAARMMVLI